MTKQEILDAVAAFNQEAGNVDWRGFDQMTSLEEKLRADLLHDVKAACHPIITVGRQTIDILQKFGIVDCGNATLIPADDLDHVRTQSVRLGPPPMVLSLPAVAEIKLPGT